MRFESAVDRRPDGCWIWLGSMDEGRPQFAADGSSARSVRRWVHERFTGPVPPGQTASQPSCGQSLCVAPEHAVFETVSQRMRGRPTAAGARQRAKTECDSGHAFTPENTRIDQRGHRTSRACRICERLRKRASRRRKDE